MANQEHLDILKQGVETWNQWRKELTDVQPDLVKADLRAACLSDANLSRADLRGARLNGADLRGANLGRAYLSGEGYLHDADLSEANLSKAYLDDADLRGTNLSHADLNRANLSRANLSRADLNHADLSHANLKGAVLNEAHLNEADLRGADFQDADLRDADLKGADFSHADLRGTNLSHADLKGATLKGVTLKGADLWGANLSRTNLSGANLSDARLSGANLSGANLSRANLSRAYLRGANLSRATIGRVHLNEAYLRGATLTGADLSGANLSNANLSNANLSRVDLSYADLSGATLVGTNLAGATLTSCRVYGISVWDVQLEGTTQNNLVITHEGEPIITVDNLKIAQFIYLLLNNAEIREVIDTIARKAVLILGRFSDERKMVLEALKNELRNQNYSPVVFNIEETDSRDFTATVRTLANMAHFVLIDLTDLNQAIREIADNIVPYCGVPIRPLLLQSAHQQQYELSPELRHKYRWVLAPYRYKDLSDLQISFQEKIIQPINEKLLELKQKKPLKIFIAYAPEDKNTLSRLKIHLRSLEKAGLIELWDEQDVAPGEEKAKEIEKQLSHARIILLLISPAFLDSHNCYDIQMSRAIERYEQGEASVIPIILQPCAWKSTPLKELQPLPKDGKPVSKHNKNDVFFEMSEDVGEVVKNLR